MSDITKQQKVLDYIKRSGALVAAAEKQAAAFATKQAAFEKAVPDVVDVLIEHGRLPSELREKAAAQLKDPMKVLEMLASVAATKTDAELTHMGRAEKSASAKRNSSNSPYVGAISSDERESDLVLQERILGMR